MKPFSKGAPWSLNDLQQGINTLFEQVWHSGIRTGPFDGQDWAPAMDVVEAVDRYVVEVELPGLTAADVEVTCTGNLLTISGQKTRATSREEQDRLEIAERRYGGFTRRVTFAEDIKTDELSATFDQGLLTVEIPKQKVEARQQVRVEIKE